ncbi:MAG: hypothetical protein V4773_21755, partial [Verrucomicrobiota bacterium]
EPRLSVFGEGLKRPPSQKELANILRVTTRHLRRWEDLEAAANRPCSRPYTHADLWHLYERRGRKGWDRFFAARSGLADVFERFDQIRCGAGAHGATDDRSTMAAMMLRSVATDGGGIAPGANSLPRMFGEGLAEAAKAQLLMIVDCTHAREVLVKAFFEAALIAEAQRVPQSVEPETLSALSA